MQTHTLTHTHNVSSLSQLFFKKRCIFPATLITHIFITGSLDAFNSSSTFTSVKLNIHVVNYNKQLPLCVINYNLLDEHNGWVAPLISVALDNSTRIGRVYQKNRRKKEGKKVPSCKVCTDFSNAKCTQRELFASSSNVQGTLQFWTL